MGKFPYEIKDWKFWKVADYPHLVEVERRLAENGLRNPWLRNEAWKFQKHLLPKGAIPLFTRGFGWGLGAFVIAISIEKYLKRNKGEDDGHH